MKINKPFQNVCTRKVSQGKRKRIPFPDKQENKGKNSFVLDVTNPPKRQYVSYPVHRLTFLEAFATEFNFRDEKSSTGEAYELVCAQRVCEIFSIPTVFTWNKTFDWALLLPQFVSTHSLCGLGRGDIVLPINVFYKNGGSRYCKCLCACWTE